MEERFTVRNICKTPVSRLNKKNNNNKYYFDVYDKHTNNAVRFTGASEKELDIVRVEQILKVKKNTYTTTNATIGDAAQIEYQKQVGKRDKDIIDDCTLRDYKHSWNAIKDLTYDGIKLEDYPVKKVNVEFLMQLNDSLLMNKKISLRQNKNSWSRLGAILNTASINKMGVEMFITKQVPRGEFQSAWKKRKKYKPDILKTNNPIQTIDLINKVLELSKLKTSYTAGYFYGNFNHRFLRTMLEGNLRISEVLPLEIDDYDIELHAFNIDKVIDIKTGLLKNKTKSLESDNLVFMSKEFTDLYLDWVDELKQWKNNHKQLLFPATNGSYKSYRVMDMCIKRLFVLAGFKGKIKLHDFRSFGAKFRKFLKLDKTSQEHLRHGSKHMTKLYERGKNWQDAKRLNEASNEVASYLK